MRSETIKGVNGIFSNYVDLELVALQAPTITERPWLVHLPCTCCPGSRPRVDILKPSCSGSLLTTLEVAHSATHFPHSPAISIAHLERHNSCKNAVFQTLSAQASSDPCSLLALSFALFFGSLSRPAHPLPQMGPRDSETEPSPRAVSVTPLSFP